MDEVKIWTRTVGQTEGQGAFIYNTIIAHTQQCNCSRMLEAEGQTQFSEHA